ncbi:hypothetical protein GTO91_12145 [Heliobacterium undosum]|uniref:Dipeptidylpeptidase IV N-terminal domain-containing protein n=1 Tax=Heliomicrobium undosum TaxID=121734 RepID=A0A845L6L2_9FIRM|nr:hypothetical protein [Heliomicrobium undosum]MZP30464.1 hypothetical protein [Heliomicrobium undosum]
MNRAMEVSLPPALMGVFLVDWLDEGRLVVGLQDSEDDQLTASLYIYDLQQKKLTLFYQGKDETGYEMTLKHLKDDAFAFLGRDKITIFDKTTLQPQRVIRLPPSTRGSDLSSDGQRLVFCDDRGLNVADTDLSNRKLLVKRTGQDLHVKAPFSPKWSNDDSQLLYILCLYEGTEGLGVIQPNGTGHQFFPIPDVGYTQWLNDNRQILCGQSDYIQTLSMLIDTGTGTMTNLDDERNKCGMIMDRSNERIAYALRVEEQEPYRHEMTVYIRDRKSGQDRFASSVHYQIRNISWAPSSRQIAYSTISEKGESKLWVQPLE